MIISQSGLDESTHEKLKIRIMNSFERISIHFAILKVPSTVEDIFQNFFDYLHTFFNFP